MAINDGYIIIPLPFSGPVQAIAIPSVLALPCIVAPISAAFIVFLALWSARNQQKNDSQYRL